MCVKSAGSIPYYDKYAEKLADSYEVLPFKDVHPFLFKEFSKAGSKIVLDIGSGTGRDAAWISKAGHEVTAVEPSPKMLALAKNIHPDVYVNWVNDSLPKLQYFKNKSEIFDFIIVSAVWMHVHPKERMEALSNLVLLLKTSGTVYLTLRLGTSVPEQAIFEVSMDEIQQMATRLKLNVTMVSEGSDLLSREDVSWKSVTLSRISM